MTWHFTMKLPAHLSESLFPLQLMAFLVKVFDLNAIILLVICVTKLSKLLFHSLFLVSSECLNFSKHSPFSQYLKSITDSSSD